jgi:general transcription factor 3C polypeptide 1
MNIQSLVFFYYQLKDYDLLRIQDTEFLPFVISKQREKFILRSELHKWLEELEDRKNTILDRKTVVRNLQKLQREGRCKCMLVSLPGVSNYGQIRTVDVVLLPSIDISPDIMTEIYERQRAFDMLVRHQSSNRWRKPKMDENIPTLNGVQRMPKPEIVDKGDTLQDNGFISAKLVRCRMLHQFLWLYTSGLTDENAHLEESDSLNGGGDSFSLLVAVQSMPLELFLQVIGSAKHIKGLAERCRRGMRLSDLPRKESEALLDLNASGRLAWLVDILRRLKVADIWHCI